MLLTILGSGTAIPVPHRGPTAAWVRSGETSLLIDCGSGALQKLYRAGGTLTALDGLFLSHAHLDHLGDLSTVLFALRAGTPRSGPLTLYHSRALGAYLDGLSRVFGDWLGRPGQVERAPLGVGDSRRVGDLSLSCFEVSHHATSLGLRIAERSSGATLLMPSDTGLCQSLIEAARGVDLLVIECAATDAEPRDGHLSPSDVLCVAEAARPGALVITHQYPQTEAAGVVQEVAAGAACPVVEAVDGLVLEIVPGRVRVVGGDPLERPPPTSSAGASYLDEAAPIALSGDTSDEAEAMRALLEADLATLDDAEWSRRKFAGEPAAGPSPRSGAVIASRVGRRWTASSLAGLQPSRAQKALLRRAQSHRSLPEVNLHGLTREEGLSALRGAIQTWFAQGERLGRIITGKGRHSKDEPVLKRVTANYLDSQAGARWVAEWAPEWAKDGSFGAVVVALRG